MDLHFARSTKSANGPSAIEGRRQRTFSTGTAAGGVMQNATWLPRGVASERWKLAR